VTLETDIMFSILFGSVIYPITIAWVVSDGWLRGLGFEDPSHSAPVYLLGTVCGFVGNMIVGLKFEHRKSVFSQVLVKKEQKQL
jgi:ammonia channel protein AmtB